MDRPIKLNHMNENERERIGKRIAELRKAKGLTQAQLAEKTGFSQSNIGRIETGRYSVGLDVLAKIAEALGASVELISKENDGKVCFTEIADEV